MIEHYINQFGENNSDTQRIIISARNALEIIASSDGPYHDVNHTIMVTLVGTEILRGKNLIEGSVSSDKWVHFVTSLLNHDIGYVRGICQTDRFSDDPFIDLETICANIERTRFPVPSEEDHQASDHYPGLLRAADLIGQLADPQYMRRISVLYQEFRETGEAAKMGYTTAADLLAGYPRFF
ncbi:MAG: hypothetical protein ACI809_000144 [Candidatus Azotimanducaceae bacterium]